MASTVIFGIEHLWDMVEREMMAPTISKVYLMRAQQAKRKSAGSANARSLRAQQTECPGASWTKPGKLFAVEQTRTLLYFHQVSKLI